MKKTHSRKTILDHRRARGLGGLIITIMAAALIQSCAVGPDYVMPEYDVPDLWQAELVEGLSDGQAPMATWWQVLNGPLHQSVQDRVV